MPPVRTCECGECRKCKHRDYMNAYYRRHPRRRLNHEIRAGRVERGSCEVCSNPKAEGHHDDYSKPLEVRWLCRTHHMELHRTVAA